MTRLLSFAEVHFWEEPIFEAVQFPKLRGEVGSDGINVVTPVLPLGLREGECSNAQRQLLDSYLAEQQFDRFIAWYYTPMALAFSRHLAPELTVYDCMDELSGFDGAPRQLGVEEDLLFERANVVFVGGASLYESKRKKHGNIHLFASSIDREHFACARRTQPDPVDQAEIPHPRVGFHGVLDERLDRDLIRFLAVDQPDSHFVFVGPVVKIREADLPKAPNIHYLGAKRYSELPLYLANWEVAMLPFAQNAATKFISPTKTPEYLAAGKPVVSTPIRDIVTPYGRDGLVKIGSDPREFSSAIRGCLDDSDPEWITRVDLFLAGNSWDRTFEGMWIEILRCMPAHAVSSQSSEEFDRNAGD
jgi:UDP-galactopyranose mutase